MAKPKSIKLGNNADGIMIEHIKRRGVLNISGWFDSIVSIEGGTVPLGEFLDRLGITEADVKKALRSYKSGNEGGE